MLIPENLVYTKSHEWINFTGEDSAALGITDYAQDSLGDIVFINLPENGDSVAKSESFGDIESVKAVSDLVSPVTGKISEINEELLDAPEVINGAPYEHWIVKVEGITDREELLSPEEYKAFCEEEA